MSVVSVIMPVYNGAAYISEAISSVLAQSFKEWELLIVNDGSTDETADIIKSFTDERIRVISQKNAGEGAARNTGLANASGKYLAFLDADDVYFPLALESNLNYLVTHPRIRIVYADGYYCSEDGKPLGRFSDYREGNFQGNVLDVIVTSSFIGASCSSMIRTAAVFRRNLRFDPELIIGTDWNFFMDLAESEDFGYNPTIVSKYRLHDRSVSCRQSAKRPRALGIIRLRIVQAPFFAKLGRGTKCTIFYQLLFESYPDQPVTQQQLVTSTAFSLLCDIERGMLLRLLAAHWILKAWATDRVIAFLSAAVQANPSDDRARALLATVRFSPRLARLILNSKRRAARHAPPANKTSPFVLASLAGQAEHGSTSSL